MFGRRFKLFTLLGFEVRVDLSWLVIAILVTWSLAEGVYPHFLEGLSTGAYWIMGVLGALGLFASVVFHEFGHSIVARRVGIPMQGITLFIFGGVAEMGDEPPTPKSEFLMAIAGPIASVLLAIALWIVGFGISAAGWPEPVYLVISYLAWINTVLVIFNMVPAFPLDGGRVLRSALWAWKGSLRWGTKVAASIGSGFGLLLIGFGIVNVFLAVNIIGGIWWVLLGLFMRAASQMSYQQVLLRRALEGEPVRKFMNDHPLTLPKEARVKDIIEDYVYRHHFKLYPVTENGKLLGCVTLDRLKQVPKEEWETRTAEDLIHPCSEENTISPEEDSVKALSAMKRSQTSRLMVVEQDRLVGIVSLKDLLNFLSLKVEMEGR